MPRAGVCLTLMILRERRIEAFQLEAPRTDAPRSLYWELSKEWTGRVDKRRFRPNDGNEGVSFAELRIDLGLWSWAG